MLFRGPVSRLHCMETPNPSKEYPSRGQQLPDDEAWRKGRDSDQATRLPKQPARRGSVVTANAATSCNSLQRLQRRLQLHEPTSHPLAIQAPRGDSLCGEDGIA